MNYLSLFSGIEAATAAWHPLGWRCVGVSEIEPFPCAVLAQRHPTVPNLGDITLITEADIAALGAIDLVVFGSPCQDLSVAGKRKGLDGERSGLFFAAMRIVGWARKHGGCRFALWENVPGAFSSNAGCDFAVVVGQMAGFDTTEVPPKGWGTEGAILGPQGMVEWSVLDAQWFGVAQRRRRVFALADFGDWASRPPILLEPESLRGDSAPSREAGQSVAGTLASRTGACGYPGTDEACDGHVIAAPISPCLRAGGNRTGGDRPPGTNVDTCESLIAISVALRGREGGATAELGGPVSGTLRASGGVQGHGYERNAGGMGRLDYETETLVPCVTGQVTHTLKADGFDASEDGTGRGTPIVPVSFDLQQITSKANMTRVDAGLPVSTLAARSHMCVPYSTKLHNTTANGSGDVVAASFKGGQGSKAGGIGYDEHVSPTLSAADSGSNRVPVVMTNICQFVAPAAMQVRRLTPRECERLQGFPDGHTLITMRGKPAADGPRYKALGNSMAVPVMAWIGRQIDHVVMFY